MKSIKELILERMVIKSANMYLNEAELYQEAFTDCFTLVEEGLDALEKNTSTLGVVLTLIQSRGSQGLMGIPAMLCELEDNNHQAINNLRKKLEGP